MEGQTISSLRTRMGAEEYAKAVACGDVIEKENHVGKLMAYEPKEKLHGIREVITKKKDVSSRSEFKPEDFHHFAAGIAAEAVQWCKFWPMIALRARQIRAKVTISFICQASD